MGWVYPPILENSFKLDIGCLEDEYFVVVLRINKNGRKVTDSSCYLIDGIDNLKPSIEYMINFYNSNNSVKLYRFNEMNSTYVFPNKINHTEYHNIRSNGKYEKFNESDINIIKSIYSSKFIYFNIDRDSLFSFTIRKKRKYPQRILGRGRGELIIYFRFYNFSIIKIIDEYYLIHGKFDTVSRNSKNEYNKISSTDNFWIADQKDELKSFLDKVNVFSKNTSINF